MHPFRPDDWPRIDHLLSTTRSVRRRLDLERSVDRELVVDCLRLACFAPNASNAQEWRFLVIDAADKKAAIAEVYREGMMAPMEALLEQRQREGDAAMVRHSEAVLYLGRVLERVPILVIPCIQGRIEQDPSMGWVTRLFGSIYPAVWNFQLALRSRGLGSTFTTAHLLGEERVRDLLGIPPDYTQTCLIPVAHTLGDDFSPPPRRPVEEFIGWNGWA
jgi:nitroreductase